VMISRRASLATPQTSITRVIAKTGEGSLPPGCPYSTLASR
jgi:hypothetical protein